MQRTAVINVVGLTTRLIGESTPSIRAFLERNRFARVEPVLPAVTCTAQSTYLTGKLPRDHGIVANGWYDRDYAEHRFWKQSNHLVRGEKLWEALRRTDPQFTCAKLFWWFNMYSSADYAITPRPLYPADGRKVFDVHTQPMGMRERLKKDLGPFPFSSFWGPASDIKSSVWIAESAKWVEEKHWPSLSLVYLPHLDYNLQRLGPDDPKIREDVRAIDAVCGKLIAHCRERGRRVIVLSEYGLVPVTGAVHINRVLREAGWLSIRDELGSETLDPGASEAFAVADHQIAHVYVRDPARIPEVAALLRATPGIDLVLNRQEQHEFGLDHERSGELVAISARDRWFTYYFWLDDHLAPDFARTVDIHRKPGYDPVELFVDPALALPKLKVAATLAKKALGFRYLMKVIPLDASLVRGSHGRITESLDEGPLMISSQRNAVRGDVVESTSVRDVILGHLFE